MSKKNILGAVVIILIIGFGSAVIFRENDKKEETYFPTSNSRPANYLPFTHSFSAIVIREMPSDVSTTTRKQYEVNLWQNYGVEVPSKMTISIYGSETDIANTTLEIGKRYAFAATINDAQNWYEVPVGENIDNLQKVVEQPMGGLGEQ